MVRHAIKSRQDYIIHDNEITETINDHSRENHESILGSFRKRKFDRYIYDHYKNFISFIELYLQLICVFYVCAYIIYLEIYIYIVGFIFISL